VPGKPFVRRSVACRGAETGGRPSRTEVLSVVVLRTTSGKEVSLAELRLQTGRMHQIRAHLSSEGHPLVGDVAYGGNQRPWCPRIFLHASHLRISLDEDNSLDVNTDLPPDLQQALGQLEFTDAASKAMRGKWLRERG